MRKIRFQCPWIALGILLAMVSCKPAAEADGLVTIDMGDNYPKKALIVQDFLNVEYVPLETNDEFVTQGGLRALGEKYIVVQNYNTDGSLYFFDRHTGKALRRINRKGQSDKEYLFISDVILDEAADELYINDSECKRIQVYDTKGQYKRSLPYAEGCKYMFMHAYDERYLIAYDFSIYLRPGEARNKPFYHFLISRQDGSITGIPIPFDKIRVPVANNNGIRVMGSGNPITPNRGRWLLAETSTDTVYNYTLETGLEPFMVLIPTSNPEKLLSIGTMTDRYYFLQCLNLEFDFDAWQGLSVTNWFYDVQDKKVYQAHVLNGDYAKETEVNLMQYPINGDEVAACAVLSADGLVDAYEEGKLKEGPLKELAAKLELEDNPVVMVMKYK